MKNLISIAAAGMMMSMAATAALAQKPLPTPLTPQVQMAQEHLNPDVNNSDDNSNAKNQEIPRLPQYEKKNTHYKSKKSHLKRHKKVKRRVPGEDNN